MHSFATWQQGPDRRPGLGNTVHSRGDRKQSFDNTWVLHTGDADAASASLVVHFKSDLSLCLVMVLRADTKQQGVGCSLLCMGTSYQGGVHADCRSVSKLNGNSKTGDLARCADINSTSSSMIVCG